MTTTHLKAAAVTVAVLAVTACRPLADGPVIIPQVDAPTVDAPAATCGGIEAAQMLACLEVRVEDTGAHYNRRDWGDWNSTAHGCDTRGLVLREQGTEVTTAPGCRLTGRWVSPYDGKVVTDPAGMQIDHRVPLKEASRSGARDWTRMEKEGFYTDLVNLVAVSARSNTSKGGKDPGRWKPPNRAHWCAYADGYITTKYAWHLSVDQREHDALAVMLREC